MSRPAVRMPVVDGSGARPDDDLDQTLDRALARAQAIADGCLPWWASCRPAGPSRSASISAWIQLSRAGAWAITLAAPDGRIRTPADCVGRRLDRFPLRTR